ncbi:hypothetical protein ANO11243_034730 [Dothideomycetidae sp. 11243]|nr:hypothetical protein ANO11243_034730 [fungal sp. No.11243]
MMFKRIYALNAIAASLLTLTKPGDGASVGQPSASTQVCTNTQPVGGPTVTVTQSPVTVTPPTVTITPSMVVPTVTVIRQVNETENKIGTLYKTLSDVFTQTNSLVVVTTVISDAFMTATAVNTITATQTNVVSVFTTVISDSTVVSTVTNDATVTQTNSVTLVSTVTSDVVSISTVTSDVVSVSTVVSVVTSTVSSGNASNTGIAWAWYNAASLGSEWNDGSTWVPNAISDLTANGTGVLTTQMGFSIINAVGSTMQMYDDTITSVQNMGIMYYANISCTQNGTYDFQFNNVDDATAIWVGDIANAPTWETTSPTTTFTDNRRQDDYMTLASAECTAGDSLAFRWVFANFCCGLIFGPRIVDPSGSILVDTQNMYSSLFSFTR